MKYWIQIIGPNIPPGPFGGGDTYAIDSPKDVDQNEKGCLVITTSARPAGPHPNNHSLTTRAQNPKTIIYARGEWAKIIIGSKNEDS